MQIRNLMLPLVLVLGLVSYAFAEDPAATSQPTSQPTSALSWEEAGKHEGETITVTGPVVGSHQTKNGDLVLNVGKDFPDKSRFTVFIGSKDKEGMPEDQFKGATITVTGKVKMYKESPEIVVKAKEVVVSK